MYTQVCVWTLIPNPLSQARGIIGERSRWRCAESVGGRYTKGTRCNERYVRGTLEAFEG